jgi:preprotein translocase subunit SecA
VLNARYHEQEAYIIAQAGRLGGVTIATNMAGRGTDIKLGGNPAMRLEMEFPELEDEDEKAAKLAEIETEVETEKARVLEAGGLFVVGTERHESRRIDNQLRGRSGRQGDPGGSHFFLSLEDDLMRIFGSERMDGMLQKLGLEEGEAIVHPWINKALEKAQQKVEARNFDIRKNLVKMDDVMNDQRKVIYEQRIDLMREDDVSETVTSMRHEVIDELVTQCIPEKAYPEQWDIETLSAEVARTFGLDLPVADWAAEEGIADEEIRTRLREAVDAQIAEKEETFGPDLMRHVEKTILLQLLDSQWKEHLLHLEHLRQGVGLRAYAQRDPIIEYKQEGFELFETMLDKLREQVTTYLAHVQIQMDAPPEVAMNPPSELEAAYEEVFAGGGDGPPPQPRPGHARGQDLDPDDPSTWGKVGRNQPCPCGSGRKYKHCHGHA